MAGLSAGVLDREVRIEYLSDQAESGYPTETWDTLADPVWMAKKDARGNERFRAGQLSSPYDASWQMQWREDMDPEVIDVPKRRRLVYRGRVFDITAAMEIGRQDGIELFTLASSSDDAE